METLQCMPRKCECENCCEDRAAKQIAYEKLSPSTSYKATEPLNVRIDMNRVYCTVCKRRFPEERLESHKEICLKYHINRIGVPSFDGQKHRLKTFNKLERAITRHAEPPPRLTRVNWQNEHSQWEKLMSESTETKKNFLKRERWRCCMESNELRQQGIITCPI